MRNVRPANSSPGHTRRIPMFRSTQNTLMAIAIGAAALSIGSQAAQAQFDRFADTPTGWWYSYAASNATVSSLVSQGWRPFALDHRPSGTNDALFVPNTGSYAVSGWSASNVYQSVTPAALTTGVAGERIVDLSCFDVGGTTMMSAITVPNPGGTNWGWLYGQTSANDLVTWMTNNPSQRIIDLNIYTIGGQKRYAGVSVSNTGANAMSWWWYFGQTEAQVNAQLGAHDARIIDIEIDTAPAAGSLTPTFAIVMVADSPALTGGQWWYYNQTPTSIAALLEQNGARLTVMKAYTDGFGATKYVVAMVDNANAQTRRCRGIMANTLSDGAYGFKLKQVGGGTLAGLNEDFAFEPASMLKIVHASYSIRQCSLNADNVGNSIFIGDTCNNNECPDGANCNPHNEALSVALAEMLQQSDNNRTYEIEQRYGRANLNNYAASLGLTNTRINHRLGCLCGNPFNTFSCTDATNLYEDIVDGTLFSSTWRDTLVPYMLNLDAYGYNLYPTLLGVINQEAVATSLTSTEITNFKNAVHIQNKGGGYTCGTTHYDTDGGWAEIPFKVALGQLGYFISPRQYTFATFVHGCNNTTEAQVAYSMKEEILREQVREALQSWDAACTPSVVTNQPDNATIAQTHNASFTFTKTGTVSAYQWQKSSTLNGTYSTVANALGAVSGATTATLSLTGVAPTDAGYYRCRMTSDCDTSYTVGARLIVNGCIADFNNSGSLSPQDIFDYLNAWFAGSASANINGGILSVQDIFDFLAAWFAGC